MASFQFPRMFATQGGNVSSGCCPEPQWQTTCNQKNIYFLGHHIYLITIYWTRWSVTGILTPHPQMLSQPLSRNHAMSGKLNMAVHVGLSAVRLQNWWTRKIGFQYWSLQFWSQNIKLVPCCKAISNPRTLLNTWKFREEAKAAIERKPAAMLQFSIGFLKAWEEGCFPTSCATAGWDSADTNLSPRRVSIVPSKRRCDAWEGMGRFQVTAGHSNTVVTLCHPSQTYQNISNMCLQHVEHISASVHVPLMLPNISDPFQLRLQQGVLEKMEDPDLANSALDRPIMAPPASWVQGRWWTARGWQSTTRPWALLLNMKA